MLEIKNHAHGQRGNTEIVEHLPSLMICDPVDCLCPRSVSVVPQGREHILQRVHLYTTRDAALAAYKECRADEILRRDNFRKSSHAVRAPAHSGPRWRNRPPYKLLPGESIAV